MVGWTRASTWLEWFLLRRVLRKHIEHTAPPRGLWCDFPLGRPLGVPNDPAFQHRVIEASLAARNYWIVAIALALSSSRARMVVARL